MAVTAFWYGNALLKALNKEINWASDTIKVALVTSAYTPNQDTHTYFSDITGEATGTGYTAGGSTLASKTIAYVSASSATAWAASTAYNVGDVRRPTTSNGYIYQCIQAGTSGGTAPTWSTVNGIDITDNTVKWQMVGKGFIALDAADVTWASSTVTSRYAVIYDSTGTSTTSALLGYVDFGADQSSSSGNFTITWDVNGILKITVS